MNSMNTILLDYENEHKSWSNTSGYGNLVLTNVSINSVHNVYNNELINEKDRTKANTIITPWNRLQQLPKPYSIQNTQYAWSPKLDEKNKKELYNSCNINSCNIKTKN